MKKVGVILFLIIAINLTFLTAQQCENYAKGEIIVGFKENVTRVQAENLINESNLTFADIYANNNWTDPLLKVLKVFVPKGQELNWTSVFSNKSIVNYTELDCIASATLSIQQQANQSINNKQEKINLIISEINGFPPFSRQSLNDIVGINESKRRLDLIKKAYLNASSDGDYRKILTDVAGIGVPDSVNTTKKAESILFFPKKEEINIDILSNITGESYNSSKETDYINAVNDWNFGKLETRINFEEISTTKSYQETPILKIFDVNLNEKETISGEFYFIIRNIGGLKFQNDYGQQEKGEYTYIPLSSGQQTITLLTIEDIGFTDLPAFISPNISELSIKETGVSKKGGVSKWLFYVVLMLFIILMIVVAYVMMRGWYKNKYEEYLFKNKGNLFNLLSYISTAKSKRAKNEEIKAKLKKAGWKLEQINYAIKKYEAGIQRRTPIRPQAPPGSRFVRKSS